MYSVCIHWQKPLGANDLIEALPIGAPCHTGDLNHIPVAARLAFEMAVNEDAERRALEGELAQLETASREAEEMTGIADRLTLVGTIEKRLDALRPPSP